MRKNWHAPGVAALVRRAVAMAVLLAIGLMSLPQQAAADQFTRIQSRWKPEQFLHIEQGYLQSGPIDMNWWSARWRLVPVVVNGETFVRIQNVWKPERFINIETGAVKAGTIEDGWWSAMWKVESVPNSNFVRLRSRWKPTEYLHIENGSIENGPIQPNWWSAMWILVDNGASPPPPPQPQSDQVRIRSRHEPNRYMHIEYGNLQGTKIQPGWWSARWTLEKEDVDGQTYVRLRNVWKPNVFIHVSNTAMPKLRPIQPNWWSAMWIVEETNNGNFVRFRNRWKPNLYLVLQGTDIVAAPVGPGMKAAQWRLEDVQ